MREVPHQTETPDYWLASTMEVLRKADIVDTEVAVGAIAVIMGARKVCRLYQATAEDLHIVFKAEAGATPRTEADLRSGTIIKKFISTFFPYDAINEEETGLHKGQGGIGREVTWYVDPLDGTTSFARGQGYSTVGVVAYRDGSPFCSVACQPFERRLALAQAGKGAWSIDLNDHLAMQGVPQPLRVSTNSVRDKGVVYVDGFFNTNTRVPKLQFLAFLASYVDGLNLRMTGSNIDNQVHVARGAADAHIIDAVGGDWDLVVGELLVAEAGGLMTDLEGNPVRPKTSQSKGTQVAIASNGIDHELLLELARNAYVGYNGFA